jgi:transposase
MRLLLSVNMIERGWGGMAAYCKLENDAARRLVEGLTNQMLVIQRRAYGLRDEEYLRLKVLISMPPVL